MTVIATALKEISTGPSCIELCWWEPNENRKDFPEGGWNLRVYGRGRSVDIEEYGEGYQMFNRTYRGPSLIDLARQAAEEIQAEQARAKPDPVLTVVEKGHATDD
ncbi:MAG TPA: hypothetical protein ENH56_19310 [Roseobacter sp.]|uniref:Uncharacterized protein n=1 Tax=marine sediment metagenome TaxID=412755 RepID=A0A0F9JAI8_9ZZZZ|nr:hypothetical protein [Roseobacter sp.]